MCMTANLALPGSGSLAAGKSIGYYQLALAALGFIIVVVTGIHLLEWSMGNAASQTVDPVENLTNQNLTNLWHAIRWPLAGLGIAATALLWAGITSLQILSAHPRNPVPPRIV